MFRRNSGCSAEHKTLGIPFRTVPQRKRMLGILYHGTKIEANSRNSVLNHSAEQRTLGIPFRTVPQRRKMLGISFCGKKLKQTLGIRSEACLGQKHAIYSILVLLFSSVPSLGIDSSANLGMPRNEHFLPRKNGSHSESIPRNFFGTKFRCQP